VKLIAGSVEHALRFERMAAEATDPLLKEGLVHQALAYRKLATEQARKLDLPLPQHPDPKGPP